MPFTYDRPIHFQDTDAAGVVFFANIFSFCHEAYEASLSASGIDLRIFFSNPELVFPIVESHANFFRPMHCGDIQRIDLTPQRLNPTEFSITYHLTQASETTGRETTEQRPSATVVTRHVAIHPRQRKRVELPEPILRWITQWGNLRG